jgi:hypothetical protein
MRCLGRIPLFLRENNWLDFVRTKLRRFVLEAKFKRHLEIFRTEAQSGAQCLYAFLAIKSAISENRRFLNAVNDTPLYWKTSLASLQSSFFIILGRVFDRSSKHNVFKLLDLADRNRQVFSLDALAARKSAASTNADEWLPEYLLTAHVPNDVDFRRLRTRAKHYEKIYLSSYKKIRNRIYAHKEIVDSVRVQTLFSKTKVRELENMFIYLVKLHECLWNLLENGHEPKLRAMPYAIRSIRRKKVPAYHISHVQQQIVSESVEMLRALSSPERT